MGLASSVGVLKENSFSQETLAFIKFGFFKVLQDKKCLVLSFWFYKRFNISFFNNHKNDDKLHHLNHKTNLEKPH